jgi:type II secretory pathway predicted ATPase ExeA
MVFIGEPNVGGLTMFLEFYNLRQQPFGVTPDPAYLYPTRTHREALSSLLSGIKDGRGFFALIAEPGMGKTTLLYQLLDELHDCARTVFLFQTQCDSREFFQYLLNELGVDTRGMDLVSMHSKLNEILFAEMIAGRRFVLIVDEAQNLEDSVLETVRLLSNFETSYAKMLQIVLAGQPQLSDKLAQPQLAQLRQRLAVLARLEPLSAAETANYIEHRLKVAGYSGAPLFTPGAVSLVAERSRGIPRTINSLCYSALSTAHARGCETVPAEIVQEVVSKLQGEPAAREQAAEDLLPLELHAGEMHSEAEAAAEGAGEEEPHAQPSLRLTYEPVKQFRLPRWAFRAFVVTGTLFFAGISLTAFMLRLKEPEPIKTVPVSQAAKVLPTPPSASIPAPVPASPAEVVPQAAAPEAESTEMDYSADPEETGGTQIITVAAMPGQTIEEIALSYAGRFDAELLQQIRALNPGMKDPNHLIAGQLIRLPLPRGSFRKGKDLTSEK